MYQCPKKLITYKEYSCLDHRDFPAHSMFTFDVCWGSLGTSIFGNSSLATNNTRSTLLSRLSFRPLWLWFDLVVVFLTLGIIYTYLSHFIIDFGQGNTGWESWVKWKIYIVFILILLVPLVFRVVFFSVLHYLGDTTLFSSTILKKTCKRKRRFSNWQRV